MSTCGGLLPTRANRPNAAAGRRAARRTVADESTAAKLRRHDACSVRARGRVRDGSGFRVAAIRVLSWRPAVTGACLTCSPSRPACRCRRALDADTGWSAATHAVGWTTRRRRIGAIAVAGTVSADVDVPRVDCRIWNGAAVDPARSGIGSRLSHPNVDDKTAIEITRGRRVGFARRGELAAAACRDQHEDSDARSL